MGRIFLGILILICGGAVIYYNRTLLRIFGRVSWAENHLGGTENLYVLAGFGMMVFGILMIFGVVELKSGVDVVSNNRFGSK